MIHSVFIVVQSKSTSLSFANLYCRHRIILSNFIYVKDNIVQIKGYKLKKIINSRETVIKETKYLIQ